MRYRLTPIFCRPWQLNGLSMKLIESHYENNYGGALRRLNAITEKLESLDFANTPGTIGDLHHAIDSGAITRNEIHAKLGEIIAGRKPGRQSETETIIFDSSGVALGDVAAAALVYERAVELGRGASIRLMDSKSSARHPQRPAPIIDRSMKNGALIGFFRRTSLSTSIEKGSPHELFLEVRGARACGGTIDLSHRG